MANPNPIISVETQFGGIRGNTPGRKHTKEKLSRAFLKDLHEVWQKEGRKVLERLAGEGDLKANASFAKIAASLEPKEIETGSALSNVSEEGLQKLIELASRLTEEKKA